MNFFGHAAVASWSVADEAFVLGAMLPDFASIIRARQPRVSHEAVERGVSFHHRTDKVFHSARTFMALERAARQRLDAGGVRRGTALAVAHIGIEIILDGILARDEAAADVYLRTLEEGHAGALGRHIHWRDGVEDGRYQNLLNVLRERSSRSQGLDAGAITWRLERALAGRARLEITPPDVCRVREWVGEATSHVESVASKLLAEVRGGLGL